MIKEIMKDIVKLLLIINISLFIISFSISFVIICKPFYYINVKYLEIDKKSGYTKSEIKEAYDDVIDYLVFNKRFKIGKFTYSRDGYNHFRDCKILFRINFIILGVSLLIMIITLINFSNIVIKKHSIFYWSGISNIIFLLSLFLGYLIVGFDKCFEIFHNMFFLGKDNWLLDYETDKIIEILPEDFFRNCSILVIVLIVSISVILIIMDKRRINRIINT